MLLRFWENYLKEEGNYGIDFEHEKAKEEEEEEDLKEEKEEEDLKEEEER